MKIFHSSVIAETRMRGWGEGPVSRVRKRGEGRTEVGTRISETSAGQPKNMIDLQGRW